MTPHQDKVPHTARKRLGYLQQHILVILRDVSTGKELSDVIFYGGSVTGGNRCISVGRECTLYYDVPWRIIDLRHVGALFRKVHGDRLGLNCNRVFNRTVHSLIRRGFIIPVSSPLIKESLFDLAVIEKTGPPTQGCNIRFALLAVRYA